MQKIWLISLAVVQVITLVLVWWLCDELQSFNQRLITVETAITEVKMTQAKKAEVKLEPAVPLADAAPEEGEAVTTTPSQEAAASTEAADATSLPIDVPEEEIYIEFTDPPEGDVSADEAIEEPVELSETETEEAPPEASLAAEVQAPASDSQPVISPEGFTEESSTSDENQETESAPAEAVTEPETDN